MLVILSGQNMRVYGEGIGLWSWCKITFVTSHVSHPVDRNILSLTLSVSFRDSQTGRSCADVGRAFRASSPK